MRHASPAGAVDDNYIAKIIFNDSVTSTSQFSPLLTSKHSPHRKLSSTLHDFSELPRPRSPRIAHQRVAGTRSLGYNPPPGNTSSLAWTSDRSLNAGYYHEGNESSVSAPLVGEYDTSPRSSMTSLNNSSSRLDDSVMRSGNLTDDLIQHYSRDRPRESPPPSAGYSQYGGSRKTSGGSYESSFSLGRTASPDLLSPSTRTYPRSGRGTSPEFRLTHTLPAAASSPIVGGHMSSRPQSTHSNEATPNWPRISNQQQRAGSLPPGSSGPGNANKTKQIDIHEALRMDPADEGTYV